MHFIKLSLGNALSASPALNSQSFLLLVDPKTHIQSSPPGLHFCEKKKQSLYFVTLPGSHLYNWPNSCKSCCLMCIRTLYSFQRMTITLLDPHSKSETPIEHITVPVLQKEKKASLQKSQLFSSKGRLSTNFYLTFLSVWDQISNIPSFTVLVFRLSRKLH